MLSDNETRKQYDKFYFWLTHCAQCNKKPVDGVTFNTVCCEKPLCLCKTCIEAEYKCLDCDIRQKFSLPTCNHCGADHINHQLQNYPKFCCNSETLLCQKCSKNFSCIIHKYTFDQGAPHCWRCENPANMDAKYTSNCCAANKGFYLCDRCSSKGSISCSHCRKQLIMNEGKHSIEKIVLFFGTTSLLTAYIFMVETYARYKVNGQLDEILNHAKSVRDKKDSTPLSEKFDIAKITNLLANYKSTNIDHEFDEVIDMFDCAAKTGNQDSIDKAFDELSDVMDAYRMNVGSAKNSFIGAALSTCVGIGTFVALKRYF